MRLFVPRDLDGFFGLFVDNLVQLLLIVVLCGGSVGMAGDHAHLLYHRILPGAAISILVGNLYYAWLAHRLAKKENRHDVTALPFGINTPSLLVYIFLVMIPVYARTHSPEMAWKMGLLACLGSGVIEFLGAFVGDWVRRVTPRAALLSTLAGIAIGFISMTFTLQIWNRPLIAMVPLALVLVTYFGGVRFPWGLPGGFLAMVIGTAMAWGLRGLAAYLPAADWLATSLEPGRIAEAWSQRQLLLPVWSGGAMWEVLQTPAEWVGFLSVIIPMGLFNVVGSLQNIESAEAGGDRFNTFDCMAANGLSTIVAALLGSCFPTTIYIGHPGWKGLGARAGYSTLNGIVIAAICLTGTLPVVASIIPIEAGIAIVLWIGIIITAQAYQATPDEHSPAVALGLFPAIAAWGATVVLGAFLAASGASVQQILTKNPLAEMNGFLLHGLIVMERGYIFTCMILAAIASNIIDRRFHTAALWMVAAAGFTALGVMHAYQIFDGNTIDYLFIGIEARPGALAFRPWSLVAGYLLMAAVFAAVGLWERHTNPDAAYRGHGM